MSPHLIQFPTKVPGKAAEGPCHPCRKIKWISTLLGFSLAQSSHLSSELAQGRSVCLWGCNSPFQINKSLNYKKILIWPPARDAGSPCLLHFLCRYIPLAYRRMPPHSNRSHHLLAEQRVWNLKGSTWQEQISWGTREPCSCLKIWTVYWLLRWYWQADSLSCPLLSSAFSAKVNLSKKNSNICLGARKNSVKLLGPYLTKINVIIIKNIYEDATN